METLLSLASAQQVEVLLEAVNVDLFTSEDSLELALDFLQVLVVSTGLFLGEDRLPWFEVVLER